MKHVLKKNHSCTKWFIIITLKWGFSLVCWTVKVYTSRKTFIIFNKRLPKSSKTYESHNSWRCKAAIFYKKKLLSLKWNRLMWQQIYSFMYTFNTWPYIALQFQLQSFGINFEIKTKCLPKTSHQHGWHNC